MDLYMVEFIVPKLSILESAKEKVYKYIGANSYADASVKAEELKDNDSAVLRSITYVDKLYLV